MSGNVITYRGKEIPINDEQAETLEEHQVITFDRWEEAEAFYMLSEACFHNARMRKCDPLELAKAMIREHCLRPDSKPATL